ncbi:hypothetical protein [Rickettsia felis]|nr:hypothetical protein [Rickettsia felis]
MLFSKIWFYLFQRHCEELSDAAISGILYYLMRLLRRHYVPPRNDDF